MPGPFTAMIAITITPAAYKALKVMRPETEDAPAGSERSAFGSNRRFFDELARLKGPRENYGGAILKLAQERNPSRAKTDP